jgi:hypothetical protein
MGVQRPPRRTSSALPFRSAAFDLVLSIDVLPHFERGEDQRAVDELAACSRPAGSWSSAPPRSTCCAAAIPNSSYERQRYTRGQLTGLDERAGIRVLRCTYANSLLLPVALAKFRLWEPLRAGARRAASSPCRRGSTASFTARWRLEASWIGAGGTDLPIGQSLILIGEKRRDARKRQISVAQRLLSRLQRRAFPARPHSQGPSKSCAPRRRLRSHRRQRRQLRQHRRRARGSAPHFAPYLRVITHPQNRGYGGAFAHRLRRGKEGVRLLHRRRRPVRRRRIAGLLALAGPATPDWSTATSWSGRTRRIASGSARLYNFCARLLFRIRIRDIDCDYRLIRRALLDRDPPDVDQRHDLCRTGPQAGAERLRGEGDRRSPLPANARTVAVLPRPLAREDVLLSC